MMGFVNGHADIQCRKHGEDECDKYELRYKVRTRVIVREGKASCHGAGKYDLMMKMMTTKPRMTIWPAVMLANRRIISTIGLVNTPTSSTMGMRGKIFSHAGTPGVLNISIQ